MQDTRNRRRRQSLACDADSGVSVPVPPSSLKIAHDSMGRASSGESDSFDEEEMEQAMFANGLEGDIRGCDDTWRTRSVYVRRANIPADAESTWPQFWPSEKMYLGAIMRKNVKGEHVVRRVLLDSPADMAGIEVGSVIVTFNGIEIAGLSEKEVRDLTRQVEGSHMKATLRFPGVDEVATRIVQYRRKSSETGPPNLLQSLCNHILFGDARGIERLREDFENRTIQKHNGEWECGTSRRFRRFLIRKLSNFPRINAFMKWRDLTFNPDHYAQEVGDKEHRAKLAAILENRAMPLGQAWLGQLFGMAAGNGRELWHSSMGIQHGDMRPSSNRNTLRQTSSDSLFRPLQATLPLVAADPTTFFNPSKNPLSLFSDDVDCKRIVVKDACADFKDNGTSDNSGPLPFREEWVLEKRGKNTTGAVQGTPGPQQVQSQGRRCQRGTVSDREISVKIPAPPGSAREVYRSRSGDKYRSRPVDPLSHPYSTPPRPIASNTNKEVDATERERAMRSAAQKPASNASAATVSGQGLAQIAHVEALRIKAREHLEAAKLLEQKATQIIDPAFGQTSKQMLTQLPMVQMDEVQGVQRTQDLLRHSLASSLATQTARQRETSYALDCDALLESRALAHRITVRRASELGPVGGLGRNVVEGRPHEPVETWEKQYETQYHRLRGGMATPESRLQEVCEQWQAERDFSRVQEALEEMDNALNKLRTHSADAWRDKYV